MARRLRFIDTNSGNDGCPTLYEDLDTGEVLVQGDAAGPGHRLGGAARSPTDPSRQSVAEPSATV